ncbi:hypothetical protein J4416_01935 [Candidatus Pacearchaeota archaeon]|nr:hypothetical protein [Candidatus Pacearchaeota archaeon]
MIKFDRRGQVTAFVIVALVIVGIIVLFFAFRGTLFGSNIPASLAPIYARYDGCISEEISNGMSLLQSQGGRIDIGELSHASDFNPFSSHLNFLGFKIPYWYGFSANNLVINNVPSANDMENELSDFVADRLNDCDFSDFYARGFVIEKNTPKVSVTIEDNDVFVVVDSVLAASIDKDSARKTTHSVNVNSRLGALYKDALSIYNSERSSLFLENYALDVLQSYAPVDGVEIQCSPKIWKTNEVVSQIREGLVANMGAIKFDTSTGDKYFERDIGINAPANVLYLGEAFPSKIEITPASQALMIAEPVGTQEGLGIMGFCYVPYHFIYDLRFPVLVQIGDGLENFQFPMVVDIDNNVISDASTTAFISDEQDVDVCSFAEGDVEVNTYDTSLNPISANVSYKCFDSLCDLGATNLNGLNAKIPICVNGELIASASGYADSKVLFSSNSNSFAEIILDKEYPVTVEITLAGKTVKNSTAVIHFVGSDGYSANVVIPETNKINLKEGLYSIDAFVYGTSNVIIPATSKMECYKISKGGIAGFFGSTKEECVRVDIPATKIDYALRGGGKVKDYYILDSELASGKIVIDVSELPVPNSLEQLQYNFEAFNSLGVGVSFA